MATEIVTQVWCDLCMAEDVKREAQPFPIVLRGIRYEIDLCNEHSQPLDELADTLDEHARKPDGKKRGRPSRKALAQVSAPAPLRVVPAAHPVGSDLRCKICGKDDYDTRHSLMTHARQAHGMLAADYRGEPKPYPCPDCGMAFGSGTGLAAHQRGKHSAG